METERHERVFISFTNSSWRRNYEGRPESLTGTVRAKSIRGSKIAAHVEYIGGYRRPSRFGQAEVGGGNDITA
jgi:hypothetical protein